MEPTWPRLPQPTVCWSPTDADDLDRPGFLLSGPEWVEARPRFQSDARMRPVRTLREIFSGESRRASQSLLAYETMKL